jgi:hypothetical protein
VFTDPKSSQMPPKKKDQDTDANLAKRKMEDDPVNNNNAPKAETKKPRRASDVSAMKKTIIAKPDWQLKIRDQGIRAKWIDEAMNQGVDRVLCGGRILCSMYLLTYYCYFDGCILFGCFHCNAIGLAFGWILFSLPGDCFGDFRATLQRIASEGGLPQHARDEGEEAFQWRR